MASSAGMAQVAAFSLTQAPNLSSTNLAKKSSEFESILLSQWLQSAQETLGSVPGAEDEDDASTQQWNGFATQQLAKAISDRGGIGIGRLVEGALQHAERASTPASSQETGKVTSAA